MQWVETTGKTIEAAKEAALDQLGVDEDDAEFEVLEEPRRGLFGLLGSDARVRARVRPRTPRAKDERRDRRRKARSGERGAQIRDERASERGAETRGERVGERRSGGRGERNAPGQGSGRRGAATAAAQDDGGGAMVEELTAEEQGEVAREFVAGLVEAFGASATVSVTTVDDDAVEVSVQGDDLGLLIGPKGQTLQAIEELARTVVQRRAAGHHARLHVDVAGYRQKRREALERFTRDVVDKVLASGQRVVLEPMNSADRKVVHDTVNLIPGVATASEGEEPRRRVVILAEPGSD